MSTILSIKHPVEGSVDILSEDPDVLVKVRWPFDISSDEWIDIIGRFRREDLDRIATAAVRGPGRYTIQSGDDSLTLQPRGDSFKLGLSRGGRMPKSLELEFPIEHLQALVAAAGRNQEK